MHFQQHQEVLEQLEQGGSALEGHCLIDSSMYILSAMVISLFNQEAKALPHSLPD